MAARALAILLLPYVASSVQTHLRGHGASYYYYDYDNDFKSDRRGALIERSSYEEHDDQLWGPCSAKQQGAAWKPVGERCLRMNLDYVKVSKTGSSTVGGVMRRIAARHGLYGVDTDKVKRNSREFFEPVVLPNHGHELIKMDKIKGLALKAPVLHVTWVREPVERALSEYYHFEVSRKGASADSNAISTMLMSMNGGKELKYVQTGREQDPEVVVKEYDFVGITERMDESMLALKHVLRLPSLCDILYVSAKNSSGPAHTDDVGRVFVPHVPLSQQPHDVQQVAASRGFREKIAPDVRLYTAANAALDEQIRKIGADVFAQELSAYQEWMGKAKAECAGATSLTGRSSDCYWNDNGCAYECLDQMCVRSQL